MLSVCYTLINENTQKFCIIMAERKQDVQLTKLLRFMKNYKWESVLGPFFKLLEATFELLVPLIVARIIDIGIAAGDAGRGYIVRMSLVLVAFGAIGLISTVAAHYFAANAGVGFSKEVRHALFDHIQSLSYSEIDALGTSTLITRMTSDVNQVQQGINLTLRLLLRSPFIVFGAMIMAFTVDSRAALTFVVVIPVLSAVVFGIMLACIPLYKRVQSRLDKVLGLTRGNLSGARVIRAFCREEEEATDFAADNDALTNVQKFVGRVSALLNPLTYVIINLAIIALIWTGAIRVDTGIITQGAVVALYNYMSQILVELVKLANLIINITKSVACGNRIQAVFEVKNSLSSSERAVRSVKDGSVEFNDVSLRYGGAGDYSLHDISFTAESGQTIGVIGGTGSGKSSLANLVPRFYVASDGTVKIGGTDVRDIETSVLRDMIGAVPQKAVLFHGSIRENMLWGNGDATDDEIYAALSTAQAREIVDSKRGGLDHVIEQEGRNLSGGQRQRLTIARALVRHPRILILDDSASALDYATDAALRHSLRKMDGAPTVFIVSQRASSVMHADLIIVLDDGRAVGIGTHAQLMQNCEIYREIYYTQFEKEGDR